MAYTERGAVAPLQEGHSVEVRGIGNSMTPLLVSGQVVTVDPLVAEDELRKGDIVLAKVRGHVYLHLVHGLRGDRVQIGNNHGHMNGWGVCGGRGRGQRYQRSGISPVMRALLLASYRVLTAETDIRPGAYERGKPVFGHQDAWSQSVST